MKSPKEPPTPPGYFQFEGKSPAGDGADEFYEFVDAVIANPRPFVAKPYYEPDGDSLIFYAEDVQSFARRHNSFLTLFLSTDDRRLVGVEVKGVKRMLRLSGDFGVAVIDQQMKLGIFLAFALNSPPEDPALKEYEEQVEQFKDVEVDSLELTAV